MKLSNSFDIIVIGGGIVGLSTALQLLQKEPSLKVAVLEKEPKLGFHQTSRNSGVIHAGIYYKPGSHKAKLCRQGVDRLMDYCKAKGIPFQLTGKVIVATHEEELPRLAELEKRAAANQVPNVEVLDEKQLKEIEPHVAGIKALYSPMTGIIDYLAVAKSYARDFEELGGTIFTEREVQKIISQNGIVSIETKKGSYSCCFLINCAGLYSDKIAMLAGLTPPGKIIPFRGEYFFIKKEKTSLVNGLIYPVPDPRFPFLGVHLTRTVYGYLEAGPNAIMAMAREGYKKTQVSLKETLDHMAYSGFWNMAKTHWKTGIYEIKRSFSKKLFLKDLQRLLPCLEEADLLPGIRGIRAQVVLPDGKLCDDFLFAEADNQLHVLNAPSPAATASLAIGDHLSSLSLEKFKRI